ncbi:MAG: efflux RND transporter periplasmic adaptor subunit [Magnetococcales bacterium]|nr:efflux RND transporter periplasmic adaptor subunit [Magnetococcales bacterium]
MKTFGRFFLPLIALVISGMVGLYFLKSGPEPKRKPPEPTLLSVETLTIQPGSLPVWVRSQGVVAPRVRTLLTSETAGRLVAVSEQFAQGAYFEKGELLAHVDPEPYHLQVANLEGSLGMVEARLAELDVTRANLSEMLVIESQLLKLSQRQFQRISRLHKEGNVAESRLEQGESELLLRRAALRNLQNALALIPTQRRTLEAEQKLKQAQRDAALLDLERTRVVAPFSGRVVKKQANLGQFVAKGAVLGEIHALEDWEIRLPVSDRQLARLDLSLLPPAEGGGANQTIAVRLTAGQGAARQNWDGEIIRVEANVDVQTRQVVLVARIVTPPTTAPSRTGLLDGQFMEADIQGVRLDGVFILPRHTVGPGDRVLMVTPENRLARRVVEVIWRDGQSVAVESGLKSGERISLTPLPYAPDGAPVQVQGEKPVSPKQGQQKPKRERES